ncbi:MAG: spermidine/putrescine ABC transporter ATP-binding protein [Rhodovulum sulfidophilum]|uniref:Spermidine/putrescine ABC transporter ATP-binding protein n=1 Tax=Rhodovulum sulfidophilum TaxID=35806 RepID=A0A2W5NFX9_RHOSU|nr:MAG: spermidine/putrescine ABC transporter ATP-binding protein [Rhodovulum sulfidophilum]
MAFLELSRLRKFYGPTEVVKNFNLGIEKGEFVSFLGPSGCGKTTTLRMVAGFETPTEGTIRIDGRDVVNLAPRARDIGMVFQAYALFPNMTVAQNVGFGMKVAGRPKAEIEGRVAEMLRLIGLPDLGARYPFQLSGGQQQRVALARALAPRPKVLLLDEPLSALDAKIRISLREEIRAIQKSLGITTIYVTHDQEEALSMSDRIVVMNGGVAEQIGHPFEIYGRPATRFVATFVGHLNTLEARLADPATGAVELNGRSFALGRPIDGPAGRPLSLALRPEAVALGARAGDDVAIEAPVREVSFLGPVTRIKLELGTGVVSLDVFNTSASRLPAVGEMAPVSFSSRDVLLLED